MLQDGETALHWAARQDEPQVVKILVDYGATVDFRDMVANNHYHFDL